MNNTSTSILALALFFMSSAAIALPGSNGAVAKTVDKASAIQTTPSKFGFQGLVSGSGANPKPTDTVKVHYRGRLPDGKEFDSSYKQGKPAEFKLTQVIACWTEGLQRMKPGGKAKLICPSEMAYGKAGVPGLINPNSTLIFEVELISISQ